MYNKNIVLAFFWASMIYSFCLHISYSPFPLQNYDNSQLIKIDDIVTSIFLHIIILFILLLAVSLHRTLLYTVTAVLFIILLSQYINVRNLKYSFIQSTFIILITLAIWSIIYYKLPSHNIENMVIINPLLKLLHICFSSILYSNELILAQYIIHEFETYS